MLCPVPGWLCPPGRQLSAVPPPRAKRTWQRGPGSAEAARRDGEGQRGVGAVWPAGGCSGGSSDAQSPTVCGQGLLSGSLRSLCGRGAALAAGRRGLWGCRGAVGGACPWGAWGGLRCWEPELGPGAANSGTSTKGLRNGDCEQDLTCAGVGCGMLAQANSTTLLFLCVFFFFFSFTL